MLNVPCLNCPDRCVGCHSACAKYKDFRATCDAANETRRREFAVNEAFSVRGDKIRKDAHRWAKKARGR